MCKLESQADQTPHTVNSGRQECTEGDSEQSLIQVLLITLQ